MSRGTKQPHQRAERETARVEAFSDGVFAIAITLLILELKVPSVEAITNPYSLAIALIQLWPSFLAFLVSFAAILIMWMNHHGVFRLIQNVNGPFLAANGFLLLTVTFVPFPTAVLARHLDGPSSSMAAAFYCGSFIMVSIGYSALWRAARRHGLLEPEVSEKHVKKITRAYRIGMVVYVLAAVVAWWNSFVGLALTFSLWVLWAILDYTDSAGSPVQSDARETE